jgi:hypothetical protein
MPRPVSGECSTLLRRATVALYRRMMRPGKFFRITSLLAVLANAVLGHAAATEPNFREVFDLIQTNAGVTATELNRAAVTGLLNALGSKAVLITNETATPATVVTQRVSKTFVFEGEVAYLRIAAVGEGLPDQLRAAYQQLSATNKLKGVVLDLRFANGTDYGAAVATTELFPMKKPVTLNWGAHDQQLKRGNDLISQPVIVLVNSETKAAAEALAAMLRDSDTCLTLGNPTAGQALITRDFPLSNGDKLRIATAAVKMNGAEISAIHPDIDVPASVQDERAFYNGEILVVPKPSDIASTSTNTSAGTNLAMRRPRLTEAELVRAHRQGVNLDSDSLLSDLPRVNTPVVPSVADPVLSRAVDLLKGLAIVRSSQPPSAGNRQQ